MDQAEVLKSTAELRFGNYDFAEFLEAVGTSAPEVLQKKDSLVESARYLLAKYEVKEDFFAAPDNAIGLLLAAGLQYDVEHSQRWSTSKKQSNQVVADSFARTLFGFYSDRYPHEDISTPKLDEHELMAVFRKYENVALNDRLAEWIQANDIMRQTHESMGMMDEPNQCNVIVLSIGDALHTRTFGKTPNSPDVTSYIQQLHARGRAFAAETGWENEVTPAGMAMPYLDEKYLCIAESYAMVLLDPEVVGVEDDETEKTECLCTIKHEIGHMKGLLTLEDTNKNRSQFIGQGFEEYKAEVFAGIHRSAEQQKKSGYHDLHWVASQVRHYLHVDLAEIIESLPAGGSHDKVAFYSRLIDGAGLSMTAKLAGLLPEAYLGADVPRSAKEFYMALDEGTISRTIFDEMSYEQIRHHIRQLARGDAGREHRMWQNTFGKEWREAQADLFQDDCSTYSD
ncbi:MAG TPA: hypothetical protein VH144_02895 [Candidatus Saccharimonadales bacterium]|nr:hypothetical protein [Candidatus Saccharimonadales bacterium]